MTTEPEAIRAAADRMAAAGDSRPWPARDPVNVPMIRNWLEAIGGPDGSGAGAEDVAPPAMIQVWTMPGLRGTRGGDDPLAAMSVLLDEAGYSSIVATNCDQVYHRYLRVGEQLAVRTRLVDVAGPKRTALGEGWFVTTRSTWTAAGELRVQRCDGCGALRHPPGPRCPSCGTMTTGTVRYVVAAGTGEVYSYVVHHHPPVPGKTLPVVIALVRLPEGVRMVGELLGAAPDEVRIGLPVRAELVPVDDELTLPAWRVVSATALPPLVIDVTPTFVIACALATRDFQDVHHDRDRAVAGGAKDIFLNILTTTGLVQHYVARWAGPDAVIRAVAVRLGVPCHAGDTLTLTGEVTADDGAERVISVTGRCGLGDHVTATVRLGPGGGR
jgi:uncharacterized protein